MGISYFNIEVSKFLEEYQHTNNELSINSGYTGPYQKTPSKWPLMLFFYLIGELRGVDLKR